MARDVKYEDIKIGDKASVSKTISEFDVYAFAGVTTDFNPVHINKEFAKNSMFKQRIALHESVPQLPGTGILR